MKKALVIAVSIMIIGLTGSVIAQNQTRAEHRFEQLREFLSLTDGQAVMVKDILAKSEEQAVKENADRPRNKRTALKDQQVRMNAIDKEIEAILTPEQLKKYESYKLERKSEMKGRRKGTKFYRE